MNLTLEIRLTPTDHAIVARHAARMLNSQVEAGEEPTWTLDDTLRVMLGHAIYTEGQSQRAIDAVLRHIAQAPVELQGFEPFEPVEVPAWLKEL